MTKSRGIIFSVKRHWTPDRRLASRVDKSGGPDACWPWIAKTKPNGYGFLHVNKRAILAHRFAWELANGAVPHGFLVCHRCDNPPCCNPAHLFAGTQSENMDDMKKKGRASAGSNRPSAKLTADDVRAIRASPARGIDLADQYGVSKSAISLVRSRKVWGSLD